MHKFGLSLICQHGYGLFHRCPHCGHGPQGVEAIENSSEVELRDALGDQRFEELAIAGESVVRRALASHSLAEEDERREKRRRDV